MCHAGSGHAPFTAGFCFPTQRGQVQSSPRFSGLSDEAGCFPQKIEPSGGALDFLCLWFFPARLSKLHAHLLLYAALFLLRRDELAFGRGAAAIFWPGVCLFWQILALWPDGRRALFVIAFPSQFGRCAHSPTDTFLMDNTFLVFCRMLATLANETNPKRGIFGVVLLNVDRKEGWGSALTAYFGAAPFIRKTAKPRSKSDFDVCQSSRKSPLGNGGGS